MNMLPLLKLGRTWPRSRSLHSLSTTAKIGGGIHAPSPLVLERQRPVGFPPADFLVVFVRSFRECSLAHIRPNFSGRFFFNLFIYDRLSYVLNGDSAKFEYATSNCLLKMSMNFGAVGGKNVAPPVMDVVSLIEFLIFSNSTI
jgi:hypothetical protein